MKKCTKCNEAKDLSKFFKDKHTKDGYYSICKYCKNVKTKNYHKTKNGLITKIYAAQKYISKKRGHKHPNYSKQELKDWIFTHKNFNKLHSDWVKSDHSKDLKPSCDRINDHKPYSFDNLNLVTWKANHERIYDDMKNGINNKQSKPVLQFTKSGVFVKEYYSAAHAGRENKMLRTNIISVCTGKLKSAYGYIWKHKNPLN